MKNLVVLEVLVLAIVCLDGCSPYFNAARSSSRNVPIIELQSPSSGSVNEVIEVRITYKKLVVGDIFHTTSSLQDYPEQFSSENGKYIEIKEFMSDIPFGFSTTKPEYIGFRGEGTSTRKFRFTEAGYWYFRVQNQNEKTDYNLFPGIGAVPDKIESKIVIK